MIRRAGEQRLSAAVLVGSTLLPWAAALAQHRMPMDETHGRMMGGPMMVFAWLLGLALLVVLVALAVFLVRRSRPPGSTGR